MKTLTLLLLFFANITFAQFRSGNIFVTSPVCQYTLSGTYTDTISGSTGQILLAYDSALVAWKYLFPDSADVITVCLTPEQSCTCPQECQTQFSTNIIFGFSFCNVTDEKVINEIETKLYPIPAQDKFFIQSERPIKNIIIINELGLIINQYNPTSNSIDVSELRSGRYVIILYDGLREKKFSVIKQ